MSVDKHIELLLAIQEVIAIARDKAYGAVNAALLENYWQIGKLIVEDEQKGKERAEYGQGMLKKLAFQLTIQFGKGFDDRNLNNMRAFYKAFPIWNAVRTELSWTHYRLLSRMEDKEKRLFYLQQSLDSGWNSRALERNIRSLAYERSLETSTQHINNSSSVALKDPYIFEFLGMDALSNFTERNLETALVTHLQSFLLELGKGFAFVARQQHIVTDTSDFYIDLVFYNYYLKCFVLIDLKAGKLTHQDIGQMDMYVRMYEDLKKGPDDNPTIGLILCAEKDETVVKYSVLSDNKQLFASKYMLYMPKEEELKELIEKDRQLFDLREEEKE
jgi:predicted nuclease of restriction endonuclease-like (RecB) superfamily